MAQITLHIPDNIIPEVKTYFLKYCPVPKDVQGNPTMTDLEWVKEWLRSQLIGACQNGKHMLASEAAEFDGNVIT
jgi:hypothetical protein